MAHATVGTVAAAQLGFQTLFWEAYDMYEEQWPMCCRLRTSTTHAEQYQWGASLPELQEWVGPRVISRLNMNDFTVVNHDYQATVRIPRNYLSDLRLGDMEDRFTGMGMAAAWHPDLLLNELRRRGNTETCYDGKPFYSTTHEEGNSGAQSNIVTGGGSTPSQVQAAVFKAEAALTKLKNDRGELLYKMMPKMGKYLHITYPPDLNQSISTLMNSMQLTNHEPNALYGKFTATEDPRLSDTNDLYVDYVGLPFAKPFIKQDREPLVIYSDTDPRGFVSRSTKEVEFGVDGRYAMAYWLWFTSVKVTNT